MKKSPQEKIDIVHKTKVISTSRDKPGLYESQNNGTISPTVAKKLRIYTKGRSVSLILSQGQGSDANASKQPTKERIKTMKEYNEKLQIVKTTLADTARIKADNISLKQATGYNALLLVSDLPDTKAYDMLFDALKRDCKDAGFKFAGTPLHKACNVVKTIKFEFPEQWKEIGKSADSRTEKTENERLFFAFQAFLKEKGLTFSATQGKVSEALNPAENAETSENPETDSYESIEDDELNAVLTYVRTCGNAEFQKVVDEVLLRGENRAEKTA